MNEPLNLFEYETLAAQSIPKMAYDYYMGWSNDGVTFRENRAAFDAIKLWPRMLRDVSQRDTSVTVLGQTMPLPLIIAPMGFVGMAHPDMEMGVVRAASAMNITTTLSTVTIASMEEIAEVATSPLWFQLYVYKDRGVTQMLVNRAEAAGYQALVLTVDTPLIGRREQDIRNRFHLPDGFTARNLVEAHMDTISQQTRDSGLAAYIASLWDASITWRDVEWLASITKLPIIVKGILHPQDALLALEHGAAAILVSNHGGRQLDTAPATIRALPYITEAVNGRCDILVDGGIRRGTDIIKALAFGAKAVMLGRPILWGLGVAGEAGVRHILHLLSEEFSLGLALCGCRNVSEISRDLIFEG